MPEAARFPARIPVRKALRSPISHVAFACGSSNAFCKTSARPLTYDGKSVCCKIIRAMSSSMSRRGHVGFDVPMMHPDDAVDDRSLERAMVVEDPQVARMVSQSTSPLERAQRTQCGDRTHAIMVRLCELFDFGLQYYEHVEWLIEA